MRLALFTLIVIGRYNTAQGGDNLTVSKKQQASVTKYVKDHYDRISLTVPQGKRAEIKAHAESLGESVNGFINRAIDEAMGRDQQ